MAGMSLRSRGIGKAIAFYYAADKLFTRRTASIAGSRSFEARVL